MTAPCVAIVGSGPSAYYTAEELLKAGVSVHLLDRLPTPFGLVRAGVAPDHPKIKSITALFERISQNAGLRFYGNVELGRDVELKDLCAMYDAVVLACGAPVDARLNIPGEDLYGSHPAGAIVAWYNGHPDYRDYRFPLDIERAVIVGNGNVALDIARIFLTPVDQLRKTDIAEHAVEALAGSRIREIHIIGRRGPAQANFAPQELRETIHIPGCDTVLAADQLELAQPCLDEIEDPRRDAAKRNVLLLREVQSRSVVGSRRSLHFSFLTSPSAIMGDDRVRSVSLIRNRLAGPAGKRTAIATDQVTSLDCGLVIRSIGFRAQPIAQVPFDADRGIVPNREGRVVLSDDPVLGLYVTGWMKRGSNGVIGTNRACGVETARAVVSDLAGAPSRAGDAQSLARLLDRRGVNYVDYDGWRMIDSVERGNGVLKGKPREKLTRVAELLTASRAAMAGEARSV
jgi:ferredoxin--NADP+ reductase